jgi:hypothetical protein
MRTRVVYVRCSKDHGGSREAEVERPYLAELREVEVEEEEEEKESCVCNPCGVVGSERIENERVDTTGGLAWSRKASERLSNYDRERSCE